MKMKKLFDLPSELIQEVLFRVPLTSLREMRSTCKKWNSLSKDHNFYGEAKVAAEREFMMVMVMNYRVHLMGLNLNGIHNNVEPSINPRGQFLALHESGVVDISLVYHCDGFLLCITKDFKRFLVWNPYTCQKLWFEPRTHHPELSYEWYWYSFAIGYEKIKSRSRNYKVLRFIDSVVEEERLVEYVTYELSSNSSRVLEITADWEIETYVRGVSIKGNTYWFAHDRNPGKVHRDFLICFDFTRERFGPRFGLPFKSKKVDIVTLSSVRDEQLAVLFQARDLSANMEIWVTSKIEPEVVSWSKLFLDVNARPLTDCKDLVTHGSFFIDQQKKIVVVFEEEMRDDYPHNIAYIFGENDYFRELDLGVSTADNDYPLACPYVPSAMQIR